MYKDWPAIKKKASTWFNGIRAKHQGDSIDVTIIQETHIKHHEIATMQIVYTAAWGFKATEHHDVLPFWAASTSRAAGVAILMCGSHIT